MAKPIYPNPNLHQANNTKKTKLNATGGTLKAQWTNKEVQQWLTSFDDFKVIAPLLSVSGETLLSYSKEDLVDILGSSRKCLAVGLYNKIHHPHPPHPHPPHPDTHPSKLNGKVTSNSHVNANPTKNNLKANPKCELRQGEGQAQGQGQGQAQGQGQGQGQLKGRERFVPFLEKWLPGLETHRAPQNRWKIKGVEGCGGRLAHCFPFLDREEEISLFSSKLQNHLRWISEAREHVKRTRKFESGLALNPGFAFMVVTAASGMGKSTFCERVFEFIEESCGDAKQFANECIQKEHIFHISYVGGFLDSTELKHPSYSIGLRVLYQYLHHRFVLKENLVEFAALLRPFDEKVNLISVLEWIAKRDQFESFVIHLDDTNHIQNKEHLHHIMAACYSSMEKFKVVVVISGSDSRLSNLKESSKFNCEHIFLRPLSFTNVVCIFYKILQMIDQCPDEPSVDLVLFLEENGGNPQILELQIGALDQVGKENQDTPPELEFKKEQSGKLQKPPEPSGTVDIIKEYNESKSVTNFTGEGLKLFMKNPTSNLVNLARNRTWLRLHKSNILDSFKCCESDEMQELREMIFGYAISGDIVERSMKLVNGYTVGECEKRGYFLLRQISTDKFVIVLPKIYLLNYSWRGSSNLPHLLALERQNFTSCDLKHIDIETLSFRIWWYFKHSKKKTFQLKDIFPHITFSSSVSNLTFCDPKEYLKGTLSYKFDGNWQRLVDEKWIFGVSCPTDKSLDTFALLKQHGTEVYWKLLIQSKLLHKRTGADENFKDQDLMMHLENMKTHNTQNWIMFVRTDFSFTAKIPQEYEDFIIKIDSSNSHHFYTPIISHMRKVDRFMKLGEAWKEVNNELIKEEIDLITKFKNCYSHKRKMSPPTEPVQSAFLRSFANSLPKIEPQTKRLKIQYPKVFNKSTKHPTQHSTTSQPLPPNLTNPSQTNLPSKHPTPKNNSKPSRELI